MSEPEFNFDLERMKDSIESGTITLPRGQTHEQRKSYVSDILARMEANSVGCSKCGCVGLHACMGHFPKPWTPEDEARLENALREVFKAHKVETKDE